MRTFAKLLAAPFRGKTEKTRLRKAANWFSAITAFTLFTAFVAQQVVATVEKPALQANFARQKSCLHFAGYWEPKRADITDQIASMQVVFNRMESPNYPDTICEVVYQVLKDAASGKMVAMFSSTKDNRPDPELALADDADSIVTGHNSIFMMRDYGLNGSNFTEFAAIRKKYRHATHFHAHYVKPLWSVQDVAECKLAYIGSTAGHKYYGPAKKVLSPVAYAKCRENLRQQNLIAKEQAPKTKTPVRMAGASDKRI